jgi:hypothetical protein
MNPIFLSHSAHDAELARTLKVEIEKELGEETVFLAPKIGSGADWFDEVMANLRQCEVMIILLTKPASDSLWVGFEAGFVWEKLKEQEKIHVLIHPNLKQMPSPLDKLQYKKVTDRDDLKSFFEKLCIQLDEEFQAKANLSIIADTAILTIPPSPERSIAKFDEYLSNPDIWEKIIDNSVTSWICREDVLYQIVVDYDEDGQKYDESWLYWFTRPYTPNSRYTVRLKIAGVTIEIFYFISADGLHYFVPQPKSDYTEPDKPKFYWSKSSIIFKIALIIGKFFMIYPNIYAFAEKAGIEIRE